MSEPDMSHAVACILFNPDRSSVLLIKRRDIPVWVLPGGGVDTGETPEAAVIREMREETTLQTRIKHKVAEYYPVNRLTTYTHFYEVTHASGTLNTGPETLDIQFFPVNALPKLIPPTYKNWINDALSSQGEVYYKPVAGSSYRTLLFHLFKHPLLVSRFLLTKIGIHLNTK